MPERIAVYPGSFDPPTFGHLDLIQRGVLLFETLIVAVATNNAKNCLFSVDERVEMLTEITKDVPRVQITTFYGLTAEFARECKAHAIIRGLRAISDFEYEINMATTNKKLNPDTDTVLLTPSEPYLFLSSRVVKEIAGFGGQVDHFVPPEIEARLRKKLAEQA